MAETTRGAWISPRQMRTPLTRPPSTITPLTGQPVLTTAPLIRAARRKRGRRLDPPRNRRRFRRARLFHYEFREGGYPIGSWADFGDRLQCEPWHVTFCRSSFPPRPLWIEAGS